MQPWTHDYYVLLIIVQIAFSLPGTGTSTGSLLDEYCINEFLREDHEYE
jgi:hypothetical protein